MLIRKTLYALLTPPSIFFILLFIIWLFYYRRWAKKLLLPVLLSFFLLSTPLLANRLHNFLNIYPALSSQQLKSSQAQAIILLSGGSHGYSDEYNRSIPNASSLVRALYAAKVKKQTQLPLLISGGGIRDNALTGAAVLQNFLQIELATPVRWVETQSKTTLENAIYSAAMLSNYDINHIILVTESSHMKRAVMVFEAMGLTVLPAPTHHSRSRYEYSVIDSIIPTAHDFSRSQNALHELLGILWYKLEILFQPSAEIKIAHYTANSKHKKTTASVVF